MGSDNLFHRRKEQKIAALHGKKARRDPYPRVLIVCEGAKTEPNYFSWIREVLGLNRENIVINDRRTGLDPQSLVKHAIGEFSKDQDFDHVYCVFDKDKHATYAAALDRTRSVRLKGGAEIHAITSVPCFEYWLLLHFDYTTRPYEACLPFSKDGVIFATSKSPFSTKVPLVTSEPKRS